MKPSIVYPPTIEYDFMKQRPQHLMKAFANLGLEAFFFDLNSGYYIPKKDPGVYVDENLNIVRDTNPKINRPYIFYYTFPPQVDMIAREKADFVIFDSVDEPTEAFAHWAPDYERAIVTADLVLCSAERLYERAKELNENVLLIPNGVNVDHFKNAFYRMTKRPVEFGNRPVVGYYGAFATWLDVDLVYKAAKIYKDYDFVLVGPDFGNDIHRTDNIIRVPHVPYEELPIYLQHFDVCLIPFKSDMDVIKSCNPVKLWEYLAAGKPVVTTNMMECKVPTVYVSESDEEFILNIGRAMQEKVLITNYDKYRMQRVTIAAQHDWSALAQQIILTIRGLKPEWNIQLSPLAHLLETEPGFSSTT